MEAFKNTKSPSTFAMLRFLQRTVLTIQCNHIPNLHTGFHTVFNGLFFEGFHFSDNLLVKIIGDTGGNFFKLSFTIIDLDNLPNGQKKKGDMFGDLFSDNGVQKLLLIAIVAKGKEDYELVKSVFDLIDFKVDGAKMIFTGDQKFINIINGIGSHTSTHPCSWCHDDKSFAGNYPDLRTFGHLRLCYQKYKQDKDAGIKCF